MGVTNRRAGPWPMEGAHKQHIVIQNMRVGQFAGHKLQTVITRCYPCRKVIALQQVEVSRASRS